jgi:hypothetical protein
MLALFIAHFLVRKPSPPGAPSQTGNGNNFRVVTEFRQLNLKLCPVYHALPRVEDCMHKIGHSKATLYSIFDNKGAFYSLSLVEESTDLTFVSTSKFHLHYTKMPLGIKPATSLYQLAFSNLLRSQLNSDLIILYQDDLFLFTNGWKEYKELMKQIFDRYHVANIRFNGRKTQLCAEKVQYLGFEFDETGVRISDARAQFIRDWPVPQDIKQVRSYLGSINYVCKLVPRYAELTFALRELLRPNAEFKWGPEQQKSFDLIKQNISKRHGSRVPSRR